MIDQKREEMPHLIMRYEGSFADQHEIDMRQLGESLA